MARTGGVLTGSDKWQTFCYDPSMAKSRRVTVRLGDAGGQVIDRTVTDTGTDKSKVICEVLAVWATTPAYQAAVTKRLKERRGIA